MKKITFIGVKGGPGSGNWGHAGRPGLRGGSGGAGMRYAPGGIKFTDTFDIYARSVATDQHLDGDLWDEWADQPAWMSASVSQRREVKGQICEHLSDQTGMDKEDVNDFVGQWSGSSNDADMRSLAIQQDAAKEFGVKLSDWQRGKIVENENMSKLFEGDKPSNFRSLLPSNQQRSLLRTMYDNAQEALQEQGIKDHVRLYRGIDLPDVTTKGWSTGDTIDYKGNAIESWSVSEEMAGMFGNTTVFMDVPVENIVSTARTGLGCLTEGEFIIMGSIPGQQAQVYDFH